MGSLLVDVSLLPPKGHVVIHGTEEVIGVDGPEVTLVRGVVVVMEGGGFYTAKTDTRII